MLAPCMSVCDTPEVASQRCPGQRRVGHLAAENINGYSPFQKLSSSNHSGTDFDLLCKASLNGLVGRLCATEEWADMHIHYEFD